MTRDHKRFDRVVSTDKRQLLLAAGSLVAGGGVLVALPDRSRAAADVSLGSLDVAGGDFTADGVEPVVDVTANFEYDVGEQTDVQDIVIELQVGGDTIASETMVTGATSASSSTQLVGRVTDANSWSASDFDPDVGETVSKTIDVTLRFAVRSSGGDVLKAATVSDTTTVEVSHPQQSEYVVKVGGSGTVRTPEQ